MFLVLKDSCRTTYSELSCCSCLVSFLVSMAVEQQHVVEAITKGSRTLAAQKTCFGVTYPSKNKAEVGCDRRHAYVFSCLSCLCDGVFQTQTFSLDGTVDLCSEISIECRLNCLR